MMTSGVADPYPHKNRTEPGSRSTTLDFLIQNDRMKQENIENLKKDIEKMKKLFRIMMLLK